MLRYDGQTGAFIDTFVTPGSGRLSGPKAILFTPTPEPSAWVMGAGGLVALLLVVRRRARDFA